VLFVHDTSLRDAIADGTLLAIIEPNAENVVELHHEPGRVHGTISGDRHFDRVFGLPLCGFNMYVMVCNDMTVVRVLFHEELHQIGSKGSWSEPENNTVREVTPFVVVDNQATATCRPQDVNEPLI